MTIKGKYKRFLRWRRKNQLKMKQWKARNQGSFDNLRGGADKVLKQFESGNQGFGGDLEDLLSPPKKRRRRR